MRKHWIQSYPPTITVAAPLNYMIPPTPGGAETESEAVAADAEEVGDVQSRPRVVIHFFFAVGYCRLFWHSFVSVLCKHHLFVTGYANKLENP